MLYLFMKWSTNRGISSPRSRSGDDFRSGSVLIVVGRSEKENNQLEKLAQKGDVLLDLKDIPSPIVLVRSFGKEINNEVLKRAKQLLIKYAHTKEDLEDKEFIIKKI